MVLLLQMSSGGPVEDDFAMVFREHLVLVGNRYFETRREIVAMTPLEGPSLR